WHDWNEVNQNDFPAIAGERLEHEGNQNLGYGEPAFEENLKRFIELPARRLVQLIFDFGGRPLQSNAYGPFVKAVAWEKDGVQYLTPLTMNDYPAAVPESAGEGQIIAR